MSPRRIAPIIFSGVILVAGTACTADNSVKTIVRKADARKPDAPKYLWVSADSGLRLRSGPSIKSSKIALMPYGARVSVQAFHKSASAGSVAPLWKQWVRLSWFGYEGWSHGSYLRTVPPLSPEEDREREYKKYLKSCGNEEDRPTATGRRLLREYESRFEGSELSRRALPFYERVQKSCGRPNTIVNTASHDACMRALAIRGCESPNRRPIALSSRRLLMKRTIEALRKDNVQALDDLAGCTLSIETCYECGFASEKATGRVLRLLMRSIHKVNWRSRGVVVDARGSDFYIINFARKPGFAKSKIYKDWLSSTKKPYYLQVGLRKRAGMWRLLRLSGGILNEVDDNSENCYF